jgi:hypothetical protein
MAVTPPAAAAAAPAAAAIGRIDGQEAEGDPTMRFLQSDAI